MAGPEGWDPARPGAAAGPGRSVYSEAVGEAICARVAAGEALRRVCAEAGLPHRTTVRGWARSHPEFDEALRLAQRTARLARRRADLAAEAVRAARPAPVRGGRASAYTRETGEAICERLENGESLIAIGRDPAMPCCGTMLKWVKRHPEFREMYILAREIQADYLFDEAREVALAATPRTVWADRLRFDVIRWQAAKLSPRKYVERLQLETARAETAAEAEAALAAAEEAGRPQTRYFIARFLRGPQAGQVLACPPRNEADVEAWKAAFPALEAAAAAARARGRDEADGGGQAAGPV